MTSGSCKLKQLQLWCQAAISVRFKSSFHECSWARLAQQVSKCQLDKLARMESNSRWALRSDLMRDALFAEWMAAGRNDRLLRRVVAHGTRPQLSLACCTAHKRKQPCSHLVPHVKQGEPWSCNSSRMNAYWGPTHGNRPWSCQTSLVNASGSLRWWHLTPQCSDTDARVVVAQVVASCSLRITEHCQVSCRQDDMLYLQP